MPNLVSLEDLSAGIALNTSQRSLASIAGPSLAGVLLAFSGPAWCYALDAASWFAMLAALALITTPLQENGRVSLSLDALLAGARFVKGQQVILAFMILDFGAAFFGSSNALLPVYARDILAAGPVGLGVLYAASSGGALLSALAMSRWGRIDRAGWWVVVGVIAYGACTAGFAFSRELWLSVLLLGGTGAGNMVSAVLRSTNNQLLTPDHLRGRVAAVNSAFVMGVPQLGQFESGLVAGFGGAPLSALTGGVGALVLAVGIGLLPNVRAFRLSMAQPAATASA